MEKQSDISAFADYVETGVAASPPPAPTPVNNSVISSAAYFYFIYLSHQSFTEHLSCNSTSIEIKYGHSHIGQSLLPSK